MTVRGALVLAGALALLGAGAGPLFAQDWGGMLRQAGEEAKRRALESAAQAASKPSAAPVASLDGQGVNTAALSAEEQALRTQYVSRTRVRQAAGSGCLKGAVAGTVLGMIIANNTGDRNIEAKEVVAGAAVGCAAGAVIGAARGHYVDARARAAANVQEQERAQIAGLEKDIAEFQALNATASQLAAEKEASIATLNKDLAESRITEAQYKTAIAGAEGNIKALRDAIKDADENVAQVKKDIDLRKMQQQSTLAYQTRLNKLEAERTALQASHDRLLRAYASAPTTVRPAFG